MSVHKAKLEHEVAYADICRLVSTHAKSVSALELLAIASNMVGKMVAMQDQRSVTQAIAMEIVAKNIEAGNEQVLAQLASASVGSA